MGHAMMVPKVTSMMFHPPLFQVEKGLIGRPPTTFGRRLAQTPSSKTNSEQ
jgi:hypothetical protein